MYSIHKQYDLKKADLQSQIEKLERELSKVEGTMVQTVRPSPRANQTLRTITSQNQSHLKTNRSKQTVVVGPSLSDKWKQCFTIKPTLIPIEDQTYYDKSDYAVEHQFSYDHKIMDSFLMDKLYFNQIKIHKNIQPQIIKFLKKLCSDVFISRIIRCQLIRYIIMVGVVIVANNGQKADLLKDVLCRYFPSQEEKTIFVKNKYFQCTIDISTISFVDLQELSKKQQKIDCLILLVNDQVSHLQTTARILKQSSQNLDPISQVLVIDGEGDIDLQQFYEQADCFIESLIIDVNSQYKSETKPIPKSITEEAEGVIRLVQILDSTSWRSGAKLKQNQNTIKQAIKQETINAVPPKVNIYQQGTDNKLQKDMNMFASLMEQMVSLKGKSLPDSQRKQRAADIIMQLAMSMQQGEQQDNDLEKQVQI